MESLIWSNFEKLSSLMLEVRRRDKIFKGVHLASTARERGRLARPLPSEGATQAPIVVRAGNGARTRGIKLGKLALYQLSYARTAI